jgi:nucleotide-binding universal stress UspA family protein
MYRTILVPLDGSAFGEYALPLALGIARRTSASVQLVHVCTPPQAYLTDALTTPAAPPRGLSREQAASYLTELAECLSPRWEVLISVVVLDGLAADELSTHATAIGTDLVCVGSVADTLVRRLPMPILLTRPHDEALDLLEEVHDQPFEHVLIPLDGSALAEEIVEPVLALGMPIGAKYTLLRAINPPVLGYAPAAHAVGLDEQMLAQWRTEAQAYLKQVADRLRGQGHQVDTQISIGPPAIAILDYAREHAVNLIAIATHGRGGVARAARQCRGQGGSWRRHASAAAAAGCRDGGATCSHRSSGRGYQGVAAKDISRCCGASTLGCDSDSPVPHRDAILVFASRSGRLQTTIYALGLGIHLPRRRHRRFLAPPYAPGSVPSPNLGRSVVVWRPTCLLARHTSACRLVL